MPAARARPPTTNRGAPITPRRRCRSDHGDGSPAASRRPLAAGRRPAAGRIAGPAGGRAERTARARAGAPGRAGAGPADRAGARRGLAQRAPHRGRAGGPAAGRRLAGHLYARRRRRPAGAGTGQPRRPGPAGRAGGHRLRQPGPHRWPGTRLGLHPCPALPGTGVHGTPDPRSPQRRNGGAEAWLEFIETRVKPWVAGTTRVDTGRQTLYGHSYGGLFVLHTLLARPQTFQRYVAASPSLWWHAPYMMRRASDAGDFSHGAPTLHLMAGGAEMLRRPGAAPLATAGATTRLAAILAAKPGLSVTLREFPGLSHGAMLPASAQAAAELAAQP
nr:alpha/beta hydrolase-fold protein [Bordetella parapertussis]